MRKSTVIKHAEQFVKKQLAGEGTGHDWWHIHRVRNNAQAIGKMERDVDMFTVDLAVLLHDVGDRKVIKKREDDFSIAESFLKKENVPKETIEHVMFIIKNMSFSKSLGKKHKEAPKEFYIVQDADRLDAIGAIGIARAFAYGGSRERPLYDPTKRAQKFSTTTEYRKEKSSTLHHFEEKLFLLKDLMNTKAGKKMAQERHKYVKEYVRRFLSEWEGKR